MKKTFIILLISTLCACSAAQDIAEVITKVLSPSPPQEMTIRKLTLSIGQSVESVSKDPALLDIVALEPFRQGGLVYVNQPFDFTYQQGDLNFSIPRTHTLQLTSTDNQLTGITVELFPIIEDDFDEALRKLSKWQTNFDKMNLEKITNFPSFPIENINTLRELFDSVNLRRFGANTGVWKKK